MPSPTHSTATDLAIESLAADELDAHQRNADLAAELRVVREQRSVLLDMAREANLRIARQDETIIKLRAELRDLLDVRPGRAA